MPSPPRQGGQAAVELVALLPALILLLLAGWQAVAVVHAWHAAREAARAGVRADVVGAPFTQAARAAIPGALGHGVEVERPGSDPGAVRVRVPVPSVLPGPLAGGGLSATAEAAP